MASAVAAAVRLSSQRPCAARIRVPDRQRPARHVAMADVLGELEGLQGRGVGGFPVAEAERGIGHEQPGRAHRAQGTRFLSAPAQVGVLGSRLLELPERDARPEQDVHPRPVRAEPVQAIGETEGLGQHRPGLGRLAAQEQGPAAHRQHRSAHRGIALVAEQADGPLGQPLGLEIGVDGGRAVGGVGEHLRRQHRPPGRDTASLDDQHGRSLGGAASPDLQRAAELLGPRALLLTAGHLGRLGEQGERTIGHARGGRRLAGRDQAAARGLRIGRQARRSLKRA